MPAADFARFDARSRKRPRPSRPREFEVAVKSVDVRGMTRPPRPGRITSRGDLLVELAIAAALVVVATIAIAGAFFGAG